MFGTQVEFVRHRVFGGMPDDLAALTLYSARHYLVDNGSGDFVLREQNVGYTAIVRAAPSRPWLHRRLALIDTFRIAVSIHDGVDSEQTPCVDPQFFPLKLKTVLRAVSDGSRAIRWIKLSVIPSQRYSLPRPSPRSQMAVPPATGFPIHPATASSVVRPATVPTTAAPLSHIARHRVSPRVGSEAITRDCATVPAISNNEVVRPGPA